MQRRRPSYPRSVSSSSSSSSTSLLFRLVLVVLVTPLSSLSSSCLTSSSVDDDDNNDRDESAAAGLCHHPSADHKQIRDFVQSGQLTAARRVALEGLWDNPSCQSDRRAKTYVDAFDEAMIQNNGSAEYYLETVRSTLALVDPSDETIPTFRPVQAKRDSLNCTRDLDALLASPQHDGGIDLNRIWDDACSILPPPTRTTIKDVHVSSLSLTTSSPWNSAATIALPSHLPCCELQPGSWAYLRLPALHEPALRLVIPQPSLSTASTNSSTTITLDLEQEGYLRLFDVAGILWPTGYLLSLCLGNWAATSPVVVPELQVVVRSHLDRMMTVIHHNSSRDDNNNGTADQSRSPYLQPQPPFALELGAGIGAPSIALARSIQEWLNRHNHTAATTSVINNNNDSSAPWIVASDKAPYSLALTMSNAHFNRAPQVSTALLDHWNHTSVQNLKNKWPSGFSLIFGSSLQGLFQETYQPDAALWNVLDDLLDKTDPNAVVLLAHTRSDSLRAPPPQTKGTSTMFRLVRRVSGSAEAFGGMTTRSGDASDFEVCVFQRTKRGATTYSDGNEL